jgi:hypothetical protein
METPRQKAKAAGHRKFAGDPCRKCGHTERYTSSSACVSCTKTAAKAADKKKRQASPSQPPGQAPTARL